MSTTANDRARSGVAVIDKVAAIFSFLGGGRRCHLAELSQGTGLPRATAHRLATALARHHLLAFDEATGWRIGPRLVELAAEASPSTLVVEHARGPLKRLRDATGESAQVYVRDGPRRVCVLSIESPQSLRTIVQLGAVLPLEYGSAGKVLREEPDVLARGWAESVEERERGVASVSAPIWARGKVAAAISVSGPVDRMTRRPGERLAEPVMRAARQTETAAGWR